MQGLANRSNWLTFLLQAWILLINVFVFFGYTKDDGVIEDPAFDDNSVTVGIIMYALGSLIALSLLYFTVIQSTIVIIKTADSIKKVYVDYDGKYWKSLLTLNLILESSKDRELWCLIPCTIFAVIGLFINFYFFIPCILLNLTCTAKIMEVIKAVWEPRYRIIFTFVLIVAIIYIYAMLAFTMFSEDFHANVDQSCNTPYSCFIVIVDQWYKDGLGGFLSEGRSAIQADSGEYRPLWSESYMTWSSFSWFLLCSSTFWQVLSLTTSLKEGQRVILLLRAKSHNASSAVTRASVLTTLNITPSSVIMHGTICITLDI